MATYDYDYLVWMSWYLSKIFFADSICQYLDNLWSI